MPLPYRWLTSLMMRYNGKSILIDCGEGTQIAMREKGWSPNPIDIICFTHFHAPDRAQGTCQSGGFSAGDRTGASF